MPATLARDTVHGCVASRRLLSRFPRVVLVLACAACPPAATLPGGCGKDVDCKGARICLAGACVDPPRKLAAAPDGGAARADARDGGAPLAFDGGASAPAAGQSP